MIKVLSHNKSQIWNSAEIYNEYQSQNGAALGRRNLIKRLHDHFEGELAVLSCPGYASLLEFQNQAAVLLKMVKDDDDLDSD